MARSTTTRTSIPMGNYVTEVGNYVIVTPVKVGNYVIADTMRDHLWS